MTRFLLIRHATIDASGRALAGRTAGIHLNERGRRQAQALAERLGGLTIDAIYSSPLDRAVQTAQPLATLLGLTVQVMEDLNEIEFGMWSNRSFEELSQDRRFQRFNAFRSTASAPDGEYMLQAQTRVVVALEELSRRHRLETVGVVSHGDLIKAAVAFHAGIPLDLFQRLEISLASVSILEIDDGPTRILVVNGNGSEVEALGD